MYVLQGSDIKSWNRRASTTIHTKQTMTNALLLRNIWSFADTQTPTLMSVQELSMDLDAEEWWIKGSRKANKLKRKGRYVSARQFLATPDQPEFVEHKRRCDAADLKFPLAVYRCLPACTASQHSSGGPSVLHIADGLHRLCKAIRMGDTHIPVCELNSTQAHELFGSDDDTADDHCDKVAQPPTKKKARKK